jgi:glutamate decarboxylase
MPNLREEDHQSRKTLDSIQEKMMRLFAFSENAELVERELDVKIAAIAQNFLQSTTVSTDIEVESIIEQFSESQIPVEPSDVGSYVDDLAESVINHSIHTSSPRYIGHMTSALPYFVRPLGKLITVMNQNVVKMETAKALSPYERQALAMIHRLIYNFSNDFYEQHIQKAESTLGIMTTGGTLANITAIWCARNSSLGPKDDFTGVEHAGLPAALDFYGYKEAVIIGSTLMHYSFEKTAGLLGIGDRNLIRIPTDCNHRIDLQALRQAVAECRTCNKHILAIVGIAGTTNSGSVDPLSEMAEIAQEANTHFHVDAAWGGPVLFSEQHRHKLAGIELADSVTIDGHKQLYLPMGIGMVLVRNPHMAKEIEKYAPYTVRKDSIDLGKRSLEGSRPGTAIFLHSALNTIGQKGYEFLIDEGIRKAHYMANSIRNLPEFELLIEPEINIILYRYIPEYWRQINFNEQLSESENQFINQFNKHLQETQNQAGRTFVSRTTLEKSSYESKIPIIALRAVIANPLTTESDIDAVLNDQIKIAEKLSVVDV